MKDYLQDIAQHTLPLGIDLVKVVGDEESTKVEAVSEDKTVIFKATFKNPVPEFVGTFGMPNLGKLSSILSIPEYKENAKLSLKKREDDTVDGITFANKNGDFHNEYRFMRANVVSEKVKSVRATKEIKFQVEVTPAVASIQRLKFMISANSEHPTFTTKVEDGKLKFLFGDHSSHGGNFVFHDGVTGTLQRTWNWPVKAVDGVFSMPGDKQFKICDDGMLEIAVDSGLATYTYIIMAQSK